MAALSSLWTSLAPWAKCAVAAITGAVVVVLGPLVFADITAIAMRQPVTWPEAGVLWRTGLTAAVVVGTAYWAHSPKGRDVWTDEQRDAMAKLKDGKL